MTCAKAEESDEAKTNRSVELCGLVVWCFFKRTSPKKRVVWWFCFKDLPFKDLKPNQNQNRQGLS